MKKNDDKKILPGFSWIGSSTLADWDEKNLT
jgi:hypothetical protein